MSKSGLFVRGVVSDLEHNSGQMPMPDGSTLNWANYVANVGGQKVKIKVKADGTSPAIPAEGDEIEALVQLDLKASPHNLLQPYRLEAVALEVTTLTTEAERDAARGEKSSTSAKSRVAAVAS